MATVADTSLTAPERELLEAFVEELREVRPRAVWLYGSRARGEPPQHEESDVDLLVIVEDASWEGAWPVHQALERAAKRVGHRDLTPWFSVHVHDPAWLRGRREIRSFFMAEVDRDKVVLYEDPGEPSLG